MASRGSTWSDAEVTALIAVWGEADIQDQLDGATRNQTIFACIPKRLKLHTKMAQGKWI